ncbi:MAG: histidine kinase [Desulfobacterales bacterium]|nr:histidine kinase [Desulfobacterales bacterium]
MGKYLSLRVRILAPIFLLIAANILGSIITLFYTYNTKIIYTEIIDRFMVASISAQRLETALAMQKGFVTYFFLTDNPSWLEMLNEHHKNFNLWLKRANESTETSEAKDILREIESLYDSYVTLRNEIISLYRDGKKEEGSKKHWNARNKFYKIYDLCDQFKDIQEYNIVKVRTKYEDRATLISNIVWYGMTLCIFIGILLAYIIIKQVLSPIRELTKETHYSGKSENEIKDLGIGVKHLIEDIDEAKFKLEKSEEHLMQSEKFAVVAKLAAGFAHSVRNPLTSVKMRLFSLERSLKLDALQKEDLDVISEEITHIDTIVQNFLEFARPPKLKFQMISPSDVIDMTIVLLKHRLESYGTDVKIIRKDRLTSMLIDAEQLKEVFVNIILNACESIGERGTIRIVEDIRDIENETKAAVIRLEDNGPGIPFSLKDKIFQPFFSTKEEGTGLGLSIAKRIIEEHGGWIDFKSNEQEGTTFVIVLPY